VSKYEKNYFFIIFYYLVPGLTDGKISASEDKGKINLPILFINHNKLEEAFIKYTLL
jgi:hypothetical protein